MKLDKSPSQQIGEQMRAFRFAMALALATVGFASWSFASADERTANASCQFIVDGKTYIDGPCRIDDDEYSDGPDFSFDDLKLEMECPKGKADCYGSDMIMTSQGTFGMLMTDQPTSGLIYWNGGDSSHAHGKIEPVILRDGCWIASNAELCIQKK